MDEFSDRDLMCSCDHHTEEGEYRWIHY